MSFKERWEDVFYELYHFKNKITLPFRQFKTGMKNVIKWFPVIYKDRDWGEHYIFILLHKKLSHMEDLHRNYGTSINSEKYADEIKVAKLLTKRIIEGRYLENALTEHDKLYGDDIEFNFEKVEGGNCYRLIDNDTEHQKKIRRRAYKHSDYMEKQDIEYLFKYLPKHINKWWD